MLKKYTMKVTETYVFTVTAESEDAAYEEAIDNYFEYTNGYVDSTDAEIVRVEDIIPNKGCIALMVVEYNALNRVAESTGECDWFRIMTAPGGQNYVYNALDDEVYSLCEGVEMLMENIESLDEVELTKGERSALEELLKTLKDEPT